MMKPGIGKKDTQQKQEKSTLYGFLAVAWKPLHGAKPLWCRCLRHIMLVTYVLYLGPFKVLMRCQILLSALQRFALARTGINLLTLAIVPRLIAGNIGIAYIDQRLPSQQTLFNMTGIGISSDSRQ